MSTVRKTTVTSKAGREPVTPPKGFWTIRTLAAKEKVHPKTIYYWIFTGKVKTKKFDGVWCIPMEGYKSPKLQTKLVKTKVVEKKKLVSTGSKKTKKTKVTIKKSPVKKSVKKASPKKSLSKAAEPVQEAIAG